MRNTKSNLTVHYMCMLINDDLYFKTDTNDLDLIEMHLNADISHFKQDDKVAVNVIS